ncbi:MAG: response regulator transcription factor [Candidatus Binataceae bacterium]
MKDTISIVIGDDHEIMRHGLRTSLELSTDMTVVGEACSGKEAVEVARKTKPDVVLLEVRLGGADGPGICRQIVASVRHLAVVMLTDCLQEEFVFRSLLAGARGYIIKDVAVEHLKQMIRSVHSGNAVLDPKVTGFVISLVQNAKALHQKDARVKSLSETDAAIIRHLSAGLTNPQIAKRVHLSPHTIKDHVDRMFVLLQVHARTALVAEALRRGLI